jgi:hypothetical protein
VSLFIDANEFFKLSAGKDIDNYELFRTTLQEATFNTYYRLFYKEKEEESKVESEIGNLVDTRTIKRTKNSFEKMKRDFYLCISHFLETSRIVLLFDNFQEIPNGMHYIIIGIVTIILIYVVLLILKKVDQVSLQILWIFKKNIWKVQLKMRDVFFIESLQVPHCPSFPSNFSLLMS